MVDVFIAFLKLGLTSFGGPIAHLGFFRTEFVERRGWISDADYADLVALCQFLPGPASSQVGFALGLKRAGLAGAIAAFIGFTLPSFALMTALALGLAALDPATAAPWLHGLKLVAVAIVAQAVWGMSKSLTPDWTRRGLALSAAVLLLIVPHPIAPLIAIAIGMLIGVTLFRSRPSATSESAASKGHAAAVFCALAFAALLFGLPIAAIATGNETLGLASAIYQAGALVFGGGHVVLPMLETGVVTPGWLSADSFISGYAAAQALPGPLFTFAAFIGAAADAGPGGVAGAALATAAVFAPGFLILGAALPYWQALRAAPWALGMMAGANAVVVGVLLAALINPIGLSALKSPIDIVIALACLGALMGLKWPPLAVVALGALAGGASQLLLF